MKHISFYQWLVSSILLLAVSFWACPPHPVPAPNPPPEPPKRALISDYASFDTPDSTIFQRSFVLGDRSASQGSFLTLSGAPGVSALVSSTKNYRLDSLQSFQVAVTLTTGDFCIGITPAAQVNRYSTTGFYYNTEVLRLYFYRKMDGIALNEHFREIGRTPVDGDLAPHLALTEPSVLFFTFDPKSRRMFMWWGDEMMWEVGSEILGPSWGDSVAFEITAHDTPRHGEARIDWAKVEYYAAPDTMPLPERKVILYWNRNDSSEHVTQYIAERSANGDTTYHATTDTFYIFQLLDELIPVENRFRVRAINSAGTSQPSATVKWPQDTL
jgi:hypothetical protein